MGHYLKMNLSVPEDYVEGFVRANNTFLHQLVFDPVSREAVPLNPYPAHLDVKSLSYAGLYPPQTLSHLLITILEKKKITGSWSSFMDELWSFQPARLASAEEEQRSGTLGFGLWSLVRAPIGTSHRSSSSFMLTDLAVRKGEQPFLLSMSGNIRPVGDFGSPGPGLSGVGRC